MTETSLDTTQRSKKSGLGKILLVLFFLIAAVIIAVFAYRFVRDLVGSWSLTDLPGIQIDAPTPTPSSPDQTQAVVVPVEGPAPGVPTPEPWDGASRVTVLIMGLDYRDWEANEGAPRTDTMILLTIDPLTKTGGMLSIPRDLWVNIPGFGNARINTAYSTGEGNKLPGGGPGLAMKTVEGLLGVPIDYYAQIDFSAFVKFIDEIGGVKIDVPSELKVDLIGDGKQTIKVLKPGVQTMPGDIALAYARQRYTEGGDFDRATRQQQVVLAIRDQLLRPQMVPTLIQRSSALYSELSSGINSNLSLDDAIRLGMLAIQIPKENIKQGIIGPKQVNFAKTPDGTQDVLKPLPEQIRILRDEIFTTDGPISPSSTDADILSLVAAENARVAVLNGTGIPGLAGRTADYFRSQGLNIPDELVGDGTASVYTTIIDHTGNPFVMRYLVDTMNISPNNIHIKYDPGNPTDVELILGNDWANSNPMP
jgi:LCP family protein required for cell wall assembly